MKEHNRNRIRNGWKRFFHSVVFVLAGLMPLLQGCSDYQEHMDYEKSTESGLKLRLNVPGEACPGTRALDEGSEQEVREVDVLLFKVNTADNTEIFYDRVSGTMDGNTGQVQRSCTVKLPLQFQGDDVFRLVVIANLGNDPNIIFPEKTKEQVLDNILFGSSPWPTDTGKDETWRPLPMWGESRDVHKLTPDLTGAAIGEINLMRAVARVDVGLAMDGGVPQGIAGFRMTDLYVYNMPKNGRCAPYADAGHYDPTGGTEGKGKVLLPSIPAGIPVVPGERNHYTAADITAGTPGFVRQVYLNEADNKGKADTESGQLCCLVVGGYYKDAAERSYYRIDFTQERRTDGSADPGAGVLKNRLDILRNYRYRVNITSVAGPGYATPEEAFNSVPADVRSEITVWDEGNLDDAILDGRYTLDVNRNQIDLFVDGYSRLLTITTNHPDGWRIEPEKGAVLPDWLMRVTLSTDGAEQQTPLSGGWTSAQNGSDELRIGATSASWLREADFYIHAGNLRKKIHVKQTLERGLVLEVTPSQVWFAASARRSLPVKVTTTPAGQVVYFAVTSTDAQMSNPANWTYTEGKETKNGFPESKQPNKGIYMFRPPVNATGKVRHAQVTVYIKDTEGGTDEVYSQALTISQMPDDFIAWDPVQPSFISSGGEVSFNITSAGTRWSAPQFYTADYPDVSWATLVGTDAAGKGINEPLIPGTSVPCKLNLLGNVGGERTLQVLLRSVDSHYPDEVVTVVQQSPSSAPDDIYFEDTYYRPASDGTLAWTNGMGTVWNDNNRQIYMDVVVEARTVRDFKVWLEVVNPANKSEVYNKGSIFSADNFHPEGGKQTIQLAKPYNTRFDREGILRIHASWHNIKDDDICTFNEVRMEPHPVTKGTDNSGRAEIPMLVAVGPMYASTATETNARLLTLCAGLNWYDSTGWQIFPNITTPYVGHSDTGDYIYPNTTKTPASYVWPYWPTPQNNPFTNSWPDRKVAYVGSGYYIVVIAENYGKRIAIDDMGYDASYGACWRAPRTK